MEFTSWVTSAQDLNADLETAVPRDIGDPGPRSRSTPPRVPCTRRALVIGSALIASLYAHDAGAADGRRLDIPVRGQTMTVRVYVPSTSVPIRGTVLLGSGDVGWVGLATTLAEFLSDHGYIVAGINSRQYLAAFADGQKHLEVQDVPLDYNVVATTLRAREWLVRPVILAGVSEGAALAVAAAASPATHAWADGVVTMGLPPTAELAWRLKDVFAWITKKDADEPSFSPHEIIARISPLPVVLIHSTRDEYVDEADYRRFHSMARDPKRLVLIEAANHRFTDKMPQLKEHLLLGLAWLGTFQRSPQQ